MNQLMRIKCDKDILENRDIFKPKLMLNVLMAAYEKGQIEVGLTLKPMLPNWANIEGKWNERLFQLFVNYCKANGHEVRVATEDLECDVQVLFIDRLTRLRDLIRKNRAKKGETEDEIKERLRLKTKKNLQRQRCHTRQAEVKS